MKFFTFHINLLTCYFFIYSQLNFSNIVLSELILRTQSKETLASHCVISVSLHLFRSACFDLPVTCSQQSDNSRWRADVALSLMVLRASESGYRQKVVQRWYLCFRLSLSRVFWLKTRGLHLLCKHVSISEMKLWSNFYKFFNLYFYSYSSSDYTSACVSN